MQANQSRADIHTASPKPGRHEDERADTESGPPKLKPENSVSEPDAQNIQAQTTLVQEEQSHALEPMEIDNVPWKGWAELENDPVSSLQT